MPNRKEAPSQGSIHNQEKGRRRVKRSKSKEIDKEKKEQQEKSW